MTFALKFVARWLKSKFMSTAPDTAVVELPQQRALPETRDAPPPASPVQPETAPRQVPKERLVDDSDGIGYKTARQSGAVEPDQNILKALLERAEAMALALFRPTSEKKDERQRSKFKKAEETIKHRMAERDAAAARVRDRSDRVSGLGGRKPYPTAMARFVLAVTIVLVVSFAPNFHDLMVGLHPILKWTLGGVCALGVSLLLVHGILPPGPPEGNKQGGKN
jgi:hypothetical protein